MPVITSAANSTIKNIRALKHRKDRDESGLFFIEGVRIVGEAVQQNAKIDSLVVAPDQLTSPFGRELVQQQRQLGVPVIEVSPSVFESLSGKDGPQGLGAVIKQRWEHINEVHLTSGLGWIAIDAAQDPGNIGTIMRTADAVGVTGLILTGNSADPYDSNALRASMGSVFSLRLVRANFEAFAAWKQRTNYTVIGTSDRASDDYQSIRYETPLILLMGSERQGLSADQMAICDTMAKIPMVGRSDSLNLAIATGVMLYEIFNQQRHRDELR
jgi:TrmH family RNA methyltransferase